MPTIELIPIGREILTGRIHEKNAQWLAQHITAMGGLISRITVLDDEQTVIAGELIAAQKRGTDFFITTGGLGPTFDDITLESLAKGANLKLEANPKAREMVIQRYIEYFRKGQVPHADMIPEREKMFLLPAGSNVIPNYLGAAPGVHFFVGQTQVFALPGPPRELEPMALSTVLPIIQSTLTNRTFEQATVHTNCTDESILTSLCKKLSDQINGLHVKTNPTYFGDAEGLAITFSVWAESGPEAHSIIELATNKLKEKLKEIGQSLR